MGSGHTDAEVTNMRRVIAKRLQASKMEVPHYYLTVDVEMDKVMSLRKEINTSYEKEGVKVSVNDFIIKATALACRQVKTDCLKGQIVYNFNSYVLYTGQLYDDDYSYDDEGLGEEYEVLHPQVIPEFTSHPQHFKVPSGHSVRMPCKVQNLGE